MKLKIIAILAALLFALGILFTSIFRTAAVKYEFKDGIPSPIQDISENDIQIDYYLPFPGRILPDHPLWPIKALRDKVWFLVTTNDSRRAELKLLFADKRVGSAKILFDRGKPEEGFSTLTKAEKYLEEASFLEKENRAKSQNTSEFLVRLAKAALKHYQVMDEIIKVAPEDAKPKIIATQRYPKKVFEDARNALLEKGSVPPENPFDWN